jgi:hypothetical protein
MEKQNKKTRNHPKRCLIIYTSYTGNTEKVAKIIQIVFLKNGWTCDRFNIKQGFDIENPPFNFEDYDFLCVGSLVIWGLPPDEILDVMRVVSRRSGWGAYGKVVPGPKRGLAFVTYAGAHLGPKEAIPALKLLELEMEHLKFKCVGLLSAPGKYIRAAPHHTPTWFHGDHMVRPTEQDINRIAKATQKILDSSSESSVPMESHTEK